MQNGFSDAGSQENEVPPQDPSDETDEPRNPPLLDKIVETGKGVKKWVRRIDATLELTEKAQELIDQNPELVEKAQELISQLPWWW